jgi:hypothetical protein
VGSFNVLAISSAARKAASQPIARFGAILEFEWGIIIKGLR